MSVAALAESSFDAVVVVAASVGHESDDVTDATAEWIEAGCPEGEG